MKVFGFASRDERSEATTRKDGVHKVGKRRKRIGVISFDVIERDFSTCSSRDNDVGSLNPLHRENRLLNAK